MREISTATVIVAVFIVAVSALFFASLLSGEDPDLRWAGILAGIGVPGLAGCALLIWSDHHRGRCGMLPLALAILYFGLAIIPSLLYGVVGNMLHGILALGLAVLAVANMVKHRVRRG